MAGGRAKWVIGGLILLAWIGSREDGGEQPARSVAPRVERTYQQPIERAPAPGREGPRVAPTSPSVQSPQPAPVEPTPPRVQGLERILVTTTRVRLRSRPTTQSETLATLNAGQRVLWLATANDWHEVRAGDMTGWAYGRYLRDQGADVAPAPPARTRPAPPVATLVQPQQQAPARRNGEPLRDPYVGTCDCPYDRKRNGSRCGGTSAYSRPGGRSPVCYVGE